MHIAITGHTKGLGLALVKALQHDHVLTVFSRSNGYNIAHSENINKIISEAEQADVFINNAYSGLAQTIIFDKLLEKWRNNYSKTIININTKAVYTGANNKKDYIKYKKALKSSAVEAIRDNNRKCRIININPGYIKTPRTYSAKDNQYYGIIDDVPTPMNMLEPDKLAEIIKWCLEQPQGIEIGEIGVWASPVLKD